MKEKDTIIIEKKPQPKNFYVDNKALYESLVDWQKEIKVLAKKKLPRPPVPDFVGECIIKMANRLSQKAGFVNYCVDEETTMLTKRGWLKWNEVTTNDIALSCDPKDFQLKWSTISEVFINQHYDGKMFHLTGNGLDALVTHGHRFLTSNSGLVPVQKLCQKDHIVLMGSSVIDETNNNNKIHSDSFVKLVGWFATEGSYRLGKNTNTVYIYQKKQFGINCIKELLTDCNAAWSFRIDTDRPNLIGNSKGNHMFWVTGDIANRLIQSAPGKRKILDLDFISELTQEQRLLLIQTMILGDGTIDKKCGARRYYQKDKEHVDAFVALCTLAGIRTNSHLTRLKTRLGIEDIYFINLCTTNRCIISHVDFHGAERKINRFKTGNHEASISYNGVVWCPTTKYGTFVCQRKGKVYVNGNSFKADMVGDACESTLRYIHNFNPSKSTNAFSYITQIIHNAFVRRIQKEQKQLYVKMKIVDGADFINSYERQSGDEGHYNNSYVTYLQENKGDVIAKFENWKEAKKAKANAKKQQAKLTGLFEDDELPTDK